MNAAGVTVTELPPTTRISLACTADPAATGPVAAQDGAQADTEGGRTALRPRAPSEWGDRAVPEAEGPALVASLADLATRQTLSAVEVSDRELTYRLEGPAVLDLLATGCPLDLAKMPTGCGTRTLFNSVQVVLTREADDAFHLTVWRSFAPHVRAILDFAARRAPAGL